MKVALADFDVCVQLEMQDGDTLEVHQEQIGGGLSISC